MSTMFSCPSCGVALRVDAIGAGPSMAGGWERGRAFAAGAAPAGSEYSRETPTADMSGIEAGVKTPAMQAGITGVVGGVMAVVGVWLWGWPRIVPLAAGILIGGATWWLLLLSGRRLLSSVERITGRDLDGDGRVGDPEFTVEITEALPERKRVTFAHFPARRVDVERFATAALNGWLTVNSPHRLSRRKFTQLRDVALDRGLLTWRCEDARQQGVELTAVGRHVFKRLIA